MGHGTNSSALLKEVIKNTAAKSDALKITSLAGVMRFAEISRTLKTPKLSKNETDRFYLSILREQLREIKFYLRQVKQNREEGIEGEVLNRNEKRLNLAVMAMSKTITGLKEDSLTSFFESIKSNERCWRFVVNALKDSASGHTAFFKRLLPEELENEEIDSCQIKKI